jgi:methionine-rich copper-binding protein CopC
MKTKLRTLISAAAVMVAVAIPLLAHMHVEKTAPVTDSTVTMLPKMVQVWFNEAPDIKVSKMTLTGPSGPVELEAPKVMGNSLGAVIKGALGDGTYTVTWQSAGDDGHMQKAEFKFTVKRSM